MNLKTATSFPSLFPSVVASIFYLGLALLPAEEISPATKENIAIKKKVELEESTATTSPVVLRSVLSHSSYDKTIAKNLLLKMDFTTIDSSDSKRPPLNIALVLDRSKSMANQEKFMHALGAARAVIENLSERDIISIITFNERTVVLSPAGKVVNKAFLFHRLEEATPSGVTDISAGLLEGIAQIKSKAEEGQVRHVLLLTDGKANSGILDPGPMRKIAASAYADGIGISTLGCSTEFDESRLKLLAEAGGGRYTYVRSAEELPTAFQKELRGLLAVVAQNVRVKITVLNGGMIRKVYGRILERPRSSYEIEIGNLRAGEHGGLLLELQPSGYKAGDKIEIKAEIIFDDPEKVSRESQTVTTSAEFSTSLKAEENQEIIHYGAVLKAMETARVAVEGFDLQRYEEARARFEKSYEQAHQYALAKGDQNLLNQTFLLKHFMKELDAARAEGKIHGHEKMREKLQKESDYQRYLLFHHRTGG